MAVCDVLREYEEKSYIQVKRVGGSSAGGIAAVMFASTPPIEKFVDRLKLIAPQHLKNMEPNKILGYSRVAKGNPFVGKFALTDFFRELFCWNTELPKQLSQLRLDTEIYSTNIYSLRSVPSNPTDDIPIALANSCRIPYFLRATDPITRL
jgi:predicted acylesterase/phospholipase RssA